MEQAVLKFLQKYAADYFLSTDSVPLITVIGRSTPLILIALLALAAISYKLLRRIKEKDLWVKKFMSVLLFMTSWRD